VKERIKFNPIQKIVRHSSHIQTILSVSELHRIMPWPSCANKLVDFYHRSGITPCPEDHLQT